MNLFDVAVREKQSFLYIVKQAKQNKMKKMSIHYLGNKTCLLDSINEQFSRVEEPYDDFVDLFSGTASVGHFIQKQGKVGVSFNDTELYAYYIARGYCIAYTGTLASIFDELNNHLENGNTSLGAVTKHYSPEGGRMYFTPENAGKIDYIRGKLNCTRTNLTRSTSLSHP